MNNYDLDEFLSRLEALEENRELAMDEAKRIHAAMRDQIDRMAYDMLMSLEGDEQKMLASHLYWFHKKIVRAGTIAEACGVKSGNVVCKWVYPKAIDKRCNRCGETFNAKFGSRASNTPESTCDDCKSKQTNQHFDYVKARREEVQRLKAMPYAEYLKTEHWQETRKAALKRARYRCQVCNTNERTLHVHHRTYENRGQEYAADVITLCENCHKTFHDNGSVAS